MCLRHTFATLFVFDRSISSYDCCRNEQFARLIRLSKMSYPQNIHPMPASARQAQLAQIMRTMGPRMAYLKNLSKADIERELTAITERYHESQKTWERKGHQSARTRVGKVKNLSTTGWGLFGLIEYSLLIRDKYLATTLTTQSLASALSIFDLAAPSNLTLLDLPAETLLDIFDQLDPAESYGRGAFALSCKKLAKVSKKTKVLKTLQLIPTRRFKKFCSGCGKSRPTDLWYWRGLPKEAEIQADWVSLPIP